MDSLNVPEKRNQVIVPIPDGHHTLELPLLSVGTVVAVAVVFQLSSIIHVGLRFFSRYKTRTGLRADDWSILASAFFVNALCILCCINASISSAEPDRTFIFSFVIPSSSMSMAAAITVCCITGLFFTKVSMLLLYKSLFPQRWLHRVTHGFFVCITIWWMLFLVISVVFSSQLYEFYQTSSPAGWDVIRQLTVATEVLVVLDVVCKFLLFILPIPIVAKLSMPWRRKVQVIAYFVLGGFCVMSSAIRFACVYQLMSSLPFHANDPQAFAALVKGSYIWTIVDACMGINEACLPMIKQLVKIWCNKPRTQLDSQASGTTCGRTLPVSRESRGSSNTSASLETMKWEASVEVQLVDTESFRRSVEE